MQFHKNVLIDKYPDNDEVKLCIFTRPIYPIQYRDRWNKDVKFACSPSAIKLLNKLRIEEAFEIKVKDSFEVEGKEFSVKCIEQDGFGSYMLIIQWMDLKDQQILYTGQFTNYRTALINGLSDSLIGKITEIYVDNTIAFIEHTNSLKTACDTVQNYLEKYEGYKVYLDFENLFGYEELLVKLAQREIKIKLHKLQRVAMQCGNKQQLFEFEGEPDLTVFYRPVRNNWNLEHYERYFNDEKKVYLKFIATQVITKIDSKVKGVHYIAYSPHAVKCTLANFLRLVEPSRIHPLYLPVQIDNKWSNVIPNDIIPKSSELVIPTEIELPEIDWNGIFEENHVNTNMENGQGESENLSQISLSYPQIQNNRRRRRKGKKKKLFLETSSEQDEYDNECHDISKKAINDEEPVLVSKPKEKTKSPPRIVNVEPIEISDDEIGPDDDFYISNSDHDTQIASQNELDLGHNVDHNQQIENEAQLTDNQNEMQIATDGNDHHTENEARPNENPNDTGVGNPSHGNLVNVIPNQTEKENNRNEVNNNGQNHDKVIETAPTHCYGDNVPSEATQSNQLNPTQSRINLKRRNPLLSWHRETKIQKLQYLPETDEESGDDTNKIISLDSSDSSLSSFGFE